VTIQRVEREKLGLVLPRHHHRRRVTKICGKFGATEIPRGISSVRSLSERDLKHNIIIIIHSWTVFITIVISSIEVIITITIVYDYNLPG